MMRYLLLLSISFFWIACHPDKNRLVSLDEISFRSTDASELYFKNMRRSYYETEERQEAAIELYTLSDYSEIQTPLMKPVIAYNWRNDFVSIMLSIPDDLDNDPTIALIFEEAGEQQKMILNDADIRTQTTVAVKIYNGILSNHEIFLVVNDQRYPLFDSKDEMDMFRITVFDYLRFVEIR